MTNDRRWNSEKQEWEYPVIHHIDGNPRNNDPANLVLAWPSDNARVRATHFRAANEPR